ncbi:hypothetical protein J6590_005917 [Homalodisca vitripennis]|nr:hypothetical protein J6590_005917 [Homalodisca vitripennis]
MASLLWLVKRGHVLWSCAGSNRKSARLTSSSLLQLQLQHQLHNGCTPGELSELENCLTSSCQHIRCRVEQLYCSLEVSGLPGADVWNGSLGDKIVTRPGSACRPPDLELYLHQPINLSTSSKANRGPHDDIGPVNRAALVSPSAATRSRHAVCRNSDLISYTGSHLGSNFPATAIFSKSSTLPFIATHDRRGRCQIWVQRSRESAPIFHSKEFRELGPGGVRSSPPR